MPNEYQTMKLLQAPLEEVLKKLYTAKFIVWLFREVVVPLSKEHTSLADELTSVTRNQLIKMPNKDQSVALLLFIFRDKSLLQAFYEALPEPVQKSLALITWQKEQTLAIVEDIAGTSIADANPETARYYWDPYSLQDPYGFFCLMRTQQYYSYRDHGLTKADIAAYLPDAIRKKFKKVIPPPPHYNLVPWDDPGPASFRYINTNITSELKAAAEFIEQGHIKYTKSKSIAKGSLRQFSKIIGYSEFFADVESIPPELDFIRTRLLLSTVSSAGRELRNLLLTANSAEPLKLLFQKLSPAFLDAELLVHLRHRASYVHYNKDVVPRLAKFAAKMPSDKWIIDANIIQYFELREETPSVYASLPYHLHQRSRSYGYDSDSLTEFSLISKPLLRGYAFLMAALGMAEIAYSEPPVDTSPFSALRSVRLTPLGEYILGKRETYEIEVSEAPKSEILLDENRLIASCKNLDAITELSLNQFMDRISESRFRMTHKSLLGGCNSRQELEQRIALFRRVISPTPPAIWEQFFAKTITRISPLQREVNLIVFKLDTDEEIRKLFTTDPVLREHCMKVEGYRIAIQRKDLKTVYKRLEQAGCLCPVPSRTGMGKS